MDTSGLCNDAQGKELIILAYLVSMAFACELLWLP